MAQFSVEFDREIGLITKRYQGGSASAQEWKELMAASNAEEMRIRREASADPTFLFTTVLLAVIVEGVDINGSDKNMLGGVNKLEQERIAADALPVEALYFYVAPDVPRFIDSLVRIYTAVYPRATKVGSAEEAIVKGKALRNK